jgi:hypothetical protein
VIWITVDLIPFCDAECCVPVGVPDEAAGIHHGSGRRGCDVAAGNARAAADPLPGSTIIPDLQAAASTIGGRIEVLPATTSREIDAAFASALRDNVRSSTTLSAPAARRQLRKPDSF